MDNQKNTKINKKGENVKFILSFSIAAKSGHSLAKGLIEEYRKAEIDWKLLKMNESTMIFEFSKYFYVKVYNDNFVSGIVEIVLKNNNVSKYELEIMRLTMGVSEKYMIDRGKNIILLKGIGKIYKVKNINLNLEGSHITKNGINFLKNRKGKIFTININETYSLKQSKSKNKELNSTFEYKDLILISLNWSRSILPFIFTIIPVIFEKKNKLRDEMEYLLEIVK